MKIKITFLSSLILALFITSCRTEDSELIQAPENILQANSTLSTLIKQTSMNDGSKDNIINNSNCFSIQLPVTVIVNGTEITVTNDDDYNSIEAIFDELDDDNDELTITFPVTIILSDFTEIVINNYNELNNYSNNCNGENEIDDDIECLDFIYPISASIFNVNNEVISTITFNNDNEFYKFIDHLNKDILTSINLPISVVLADGTQITINSLKQLEDTIKLYGDDCDEDDDYDYNDDDCNNCTTNQLETLLIGCSNWYVDDLERDDEDYGDLYDGYLFNFLTNDSLTVTWNTTTFTGTWSISGSGNNITVTINIPDLPHFNTNWYLHEIEKNNNETKIKLKVGDDDELKYKNNTCN